MASKKYPDDVSEAIKTERHMRLNRSFKKEITYQKKSGSILEKSTPFYLSPILKPRIREIKCPAAQMVIN